MCGLCKGKIKTKAIVPDGMHEIGNQIMGRQVFIDISSAKTKGLQVARPYWLIIVEEETQAKFSIF